MPHPKKGTGCVEVRLAYVLNVDDLNKAMDCLAKALETYRKEELTESSLADVKLV